MINLKAKNEELISFDEIDQIIKKHRALNHPLFEYLQEKSKEGFTPQQFDIYRINYFYRTLNTIPSIARLVTAAALNLDMETLAAAGKNLYEETGCSDSKRSHSKLLQESHNTHGKNVFGLDHVSLNHAKNSAYLIREALVFERKQRDLYCNENYAIVIGAAYAQESAASSMLVNFYETFFTSYKTNYITQEFYQISEYFLVHIAGLEAEHSKEVRLAAHRLAHDQENLHGIIAGVTGFLATQSLLWDGLYRELRLAENLGKKVAVQ